MSFHAKDRIIDGFCQNIWELGRRHMQNFTSTIVNKNDWSMYVDPADHKNYLRCLYKSQEGDKDIVFSLYRPDLDTEVQEYVEGFSLKLEEKDQLKALLKLLGNRVGV